LEAPLKISFSSTDILLILVNLVPLWGVWFKDWNVKEIFLVYCLESVIMGVYNVLMMWSTTLIKRKEVWVNGNASSIVSGYYFILFFIVHYGFFIFIQIGMFISVAHVGNLNFTDTFVFLFHVKRYMPPATYQLLLLFIASYGIIVSKDFFIPGLYKTASLSSLMFAPYARVIVQQFCLLIGGLLLVFSLGKIFMLVFVFVKIFFEVELKYLTKWKLSMVN
jgi:hypothetical protein